MSPKSKIVFHNKITANYREVHIDGAFGGITPRNYINLSFYSERFPIPKSSTFEVNENATIGKLISNSDDSKIGIIREYEFGVYMDMRTAAELGRFLLEKVNELNKLNNPEKKKNK
jgi:hypothetical protein